ncbi:MAG: DEAD/SNF2-like helicase [Hyperionvirus sp.]|uniref:DEAD/SNF2-like helicase n=1 Tax=Hyperionvirus sp. TaxID=2487770 RepID=A0A3G5AC13_9VIRU|nr:MAG: DEAD/SNF2-like helicase [Hyperionvirus sp.]
MDPKIVQELLPFQIPQVINILEKLTNRGVCLDGSDTGIGKTYVAMAVAKHLDLQPFIMCPKTIINSWEKIAGIFDVKPLGIVNYETATRGKYYDSKGSRKTCPYLEQSKGAITYKWKLPENSMLIFDEVHRCCNENTLHGKLLMSTLSIYNTSCPMLLLSATVADDMAHIKILGLLFGWYKSINWIPDWMKNKNFNPKHARLLIHKKLFPEYGCRIRISDLGDKFPKSQLSADCYNIDNTDTIDAAYKDIQDAINTLKNKTAQSDPLHNNSLVKIIRARQKIELTKIPLFADLVQQYLENNYSVVIFFNFTDTLKILANKLETKCVVFGEQTLKERLKNINDFMDNKERVIICNINAGGESISLHDKHGDHPRVALISPTWSSNKLIQACGRIHRSDSQTPATNKIIYTAKTIEQYMCNKLESKLTNLSQITDDDLILD